MSVSTDAVDPCNDDLVRAKLTMFNLDNTNVLGPVARSMVSVNQRLIP